MHFLVQSPGVAGFVCDLDGPVWLRLSLPLLSHLAGPHQHFKAVVLDAWRSKVCFDLCRLQSFRGGLISDIADSVQLLHASHVRDGDEALFRSILAVEGWNGFLLGQATGEIVLCRFRGGHLFWECAHLPLVQIREILNLHEICGNPDVT